MSAPCVTRVDENKSDTRADYLTGYVNEWCNGQDDPISLEPISVGVCVQGQCFEGKEPAPLTQALAVKERHPTTRAKYTLKLWSDARRTRRRSPTPSASFYGDFISRVNFTKLPSDFKTWQSYVDARNKAGLNWRDKDTEIRIKNNWWAERRQRYKHWALKTLGPEWEKIVGSDWEKKLKLYWG